MFNNIQKIIISKPFLISLILVCMMFTSLGVDTNHVYAVNLNESDEMGLKTDVEDKLENSQENDAMQVTSHENYILQANSYSLNGGTFKDIQDVINKAKSGDTIKLKGNFVSTGGDTISLSKKLTFTSSSQATLDGKSSAVILKIYSGGAQSKFSNLKFINGYSNDRGGAAFIAAKSVTFDNCVFENNHADVTSGAIHTPYKADSAQGLTIKNCNFTRNDAGIAAGAVGAYSHGFLVDHCIFDSNYVEFENESYGGAIQVGLDIMPSYGVVKNCIFKNNKAISSNGISHGGAACVRNGSTYYNCVFINNSADYGGALTYHASGNLNNCTLIGNTAGKYGGGISILMDYLDLMNLNITNSIFKGNKAPLGGAVKLDGFNITIKNSTFDDNYASWYGGAVNINASNVKIMYSEFNRNIANIDGGAVFIKGRDTVIENSGFISNEAIPDVNKLNDGLGGAIYVNSTKVLAQNNVFKFNTARNGSAIYFDKSGLEFKLKNNTFYQNQAWVYHLPVFTHDIYYGEVENFKSVIYGGNNIANFDNLNVSNAIYNAADGDRIEIDGENPIVGATDSGELYQDDREYNVNILVMVQHEDGTVVYNKTLNSSYLGEVADNVDNLKPGKYYVTAKHLEDNYYKAITNTTVFNVIPKTDNKILKTSNRDSIDYGDTVVWTLNITNNGPNDATGVVVYDVLPEGLIWLNDDSNGAYNPKTGVLTIGSLKVGETLIVNILTRVNATGDIVNKANVTGNEFDIDLDNNYDEEQINVPAAVDVAVSKNVNVSNPNFGDLIMWNIIVFNYGPDDAHEVILREVFSESLIWIGDDSQGKYNPSSGIWNIGTLSKGESIELNIISKVNQTGNITNNVSVTSREFDINLTNNHDSEIIVVNKSGDLAIVKTVNASTVDYGGIIKWTLTASNNGPDKVADVIVEDEIPDGLILLNYTASKGFYDMGMWALCCLENGETQTLELICKAVKSGSITNIASISGMEYDPIPDNNVDNESVDVSMACDIAVLKQVDIENPFFGDIVTWMIEVRNNGPNPATNVEVFDMLSGELIFKDYVSTRGIYENGIWSLDYLDVGECEYLNISCYVNGLGSIVNNVSATSNEYDLDMSNNYAEKMIDSFSISDLSIEKTANVSNANYNDLVKWTLIVSNHGPNNATGVTVEDHLPDSLQLIDVVCDGIYMEGIWRIGDLDVGESKKLEIITKIIKTGDIANNAMVYGNEMDLNPSNDGDEYVVHVPPAVDLSITKTVSKYEYHVGDIIDYAIGIRNGGPGDALNVKVSENFPDSLVLKSVKKSAGTFDTLKNEWLIDKLAAGAEEKLYMKFEAVRSGIFENLVSVVNDIFDYNSDNNFDSALVKVVSWSNNSSINLINNITENSTDNNIVKAGNVKYPIDSLERNLTSNLIALFVVSALGFIIFGGSNIFRKR